LIKILSVFAVIASAGIVLTGCDSPASVGNGYDEIVSAEAFAPALNSAADGAFKTIKFRFELIRNGERLHGSEGIVSTQDDSDLVLYAPFFDTKACLYRNYGVPASDEYLNIRWFGDDSIFGRIYLKAKMKAESGTITTITLDYNGWKDGKPKILTKNLYDVSVTTDSKDWDDALRQYLK